MFAECCRFLKLLKHAHARSRSYDFDSGSHSNDASSHSNDCGSHSYDVDSLLILKDQRTVHTGISSSKPSALVKPSQIVELETFVELTHMGGSRLQITSPT